MGLRSYSLRLLINWFLLISLVSAQFNEQEKQKYVDCFINYLNNLPQPLYFFEDGILLNAQDIGNDQYEIEASITGREFNDPDIVKVFKCKTRISNNLNDGATMADNEHSCVEEITEPQESTVQTEIEDVELTQVTEPLFMQQPVKLENEVQPDNVQTSGEQFVAIPRPSPSVPCIGCASNVNVEAAGVHELAIFAVKHLDRHDNNNRHSLVSVIEVKRQVQVVNGVRYILTLNLDFDNCSQILNQDCKEQKTCKISILEKPWLKLSDGSKFRAVVSNNCTEDWLFDENSEILPTIPERHQENQDHNETIKPSDDESKKGDDTIIVAHDVGLQSQIPTQQSIITEEHLKNIQKQIITEEDEQSAKNVIKFINSVNTISKLNSLTNNNEESVKKYEENSNKQNIPIEKSNKEHTTSLPTISNEKIKAIEDLMSFFEFNIKTNSNSDQNNVRIRRHYGTNINLNSEMNKYYKLKSNAENAKYLYSLAQAMVDHLNEMEPQIKTRVLKDVIKAEEEFDNNESFVYIQARVSNTCDEVKCKTNKIQNEICNAVIKTSDHINPEIINAFCHFENVGHKLGKITPVPLYDPILVKLSSDALKKIESESSNEKALKILKVLDASTQTLSGTVTKFTMEIAFLDCENTTPIWKRLNCTKLVDFGTMICSVIVHSRAWLKKTNMDYTCIDRPQNEVFDFESDNDVDSVSNSKTLKMAQDVLEHLNLDANINYKPRVVEVTSVSTQLVAGLLTNINFTLGLTKCPDELGMKASNCELLDDEPLRKCIAHIWERPWIEKGKLVNVTCDQTVGKVKLEYVRKRRSVIPGGIQVQDGNKEQYLIMANKSLLKYYELSNVENVHKIVKVTKASTQVVAGSLTKIDFDISPTSCLVKDLTTKMETECQLKDQTQILHCHSEIWSRPWLPDGEQITIDCKDENSPSTKNKVENENNLHNSRKVRQADQLLVGGIQEQNKNDEKYLQMAEKSLLHFYKLSNIENVHKVVKVTNASTQVVAGSLTRVDFDITPTTCLVKDLDSQMGNCELKNPTEVHNCHSEIWSRPWLPDGEQITIDCKDKNSPSTKNKAENENNLHNSRKVRQADQPLVGGIQEQNTNDEKYLQMAEKSLLHFYKLSNIENVHKVVKVTNASTQVVAGSLTRVDFDITPTTCLVKDLDSQMGNCELKNPTEILNCHSEIWSRPWLPDGEQITIDCKHENSPTKNKAENVNHLHNYIKVRQDDLTLVGGIQKQNPNDEKYLQMAEKSLLHFYKLSNIENVHKVVKVTNASTQVVAGSLTRVDFDITPTTCLVKDLDSQMGNCELKNPTEVLNCHSEIWSRLWLPDGEQITIDCKDEKNVRVKRNMIGGPKKQDANKDEYIKLAEDALHKYELLSKFEYAHRVTKVDHVTTQVVSGKLTKIDFTTFQTICFANEISRSVRRKCNFQIPKTEQKCKAKIWERPWLKTNGKEVTVNCNIIKPNINHSDKPINEKSVSKSVTINDQPFSQDRSKRYIRTKEEEFIDEDTSNFYADRALRNLNSVSDSGNLYKLVSIHNTQNSYHMNVQLVRMYIEVALTYCTEDNKPQSLDRCDEIEGVSHRMCLARIWPSLQDEHILDNVDVVCDDDSKFPSVTGISISDLVEASITEIEKSSKVKYKLIMKGEPKIIPSLESSNPTKLNFIVQPLTCHKNISLDKMNKECKLAYSKPARECISYIWLSPGETVVRKIKAFCIIDKTRRKRSVNNTQEMDLEIQKFIEDSIEKLEMSSLHRYKQKLLRLNNVSRKFTSGRVTTIDFDVGYTSCLKYEWVENLKSCEFVEHLPRRHCVSNIWERLWDKNGNFIDVSCVDDQTPLEGRMDIENKTVTEELAKEALKHIEARYPHPYKQTIVRILSLEKQAVAGIHYRMKVEVGYTDCPALSVRQDCNSTEMGLNKFCRVNVWIRSWVNNGANIRVSCDYQESTMADIYHHLQAEHLFGEFVATHKPKYANDWNEMARRFEIFKDNVKKIHEFNTHERGTATYAVTEFSDLTYEEFSTKYLGLKPGLKNENDIPMPKAGIPDVEVPVNFDWRDHGAVTEVKNQGSCGSCWAFSVTGNIEGQWKLKKGELISLSEQELVDCDKLDEGCNGGLPDNAYRAIEELGGLETEDDYPYEGVNDKCAYNKTMSRVQISGAVNITTNETDMAKWLTKNGPISIGINANAMQFYVGGISHPWKALCSPKNLDHGVLIVGYGIKDYPLFNKHLPYWTIKNSWGKSWGEQGYYRVYRGDGTCGVNQMASSALI